jgi:hypothetical protein
MDLILFYAAVIYATWVFYTSVMCLRRARNEGRLTPVIRPIAYMTLFIGLVLDVFLNAIMSLPLLELPRWFAGEILLTSRLKRLVTGNGWRAKQAKFWCNNFLEPFDQGHCS